MGGHVEGLAARQTPHQPLRPLTLAGRLIDTRDDDLEVDSQSRKQLVPSR
jgi:hypothetical protein